jgi:hypothetical protein
VHDWICFAPVPERFDGEAGVEFAAALIKIFDGGAEKRLSEALQSR